MSNFAVFWAKIFKSIITILLNISETVTVFSTKFRRAIVPFLLMFVFGMFTFPPLILLIFSGPGLFILMLVMIPVILSFLGRQAYMFLHMWKYVADKAYEDTVFDNKHKRNTRKSYDQYKKEYIDEQNRKYEEQRRRDEEERRRRQEYENERWRQIFEEYFERAGRNAGGYQGGSQGSNNGGYRPGGGYNPFPQFKQQYESACDVLGVPYSADYSQIKSAYRKLAKKYHPDLSTENNAEEMFKKINNAFEFLSEENVRRYKSI